MTEQEREVVVDAAVAVGQIGVAHPARLDPHDHVVRAGIRDGDVDEFDGRAFAAGDDALDLLGHVKTSRFGSSTERTIRPNSLRQLIYHSTIWVAGCAVKAPPHLDAGCVLEYILPYQ